MRLPSVVENEIAEGAALMNADGKQTAVMVPVNDDSALLVSVECASSMLGIGRTQTFSLIMSGAISSIKIGRRRLVVRRDLKDFVRRECEIQNQADCPLRA